MQLNNLLEIFAALEGKTLPTVENPILAIFKIIEMLFVFSLLMRKCSPFQKSAMMTALSLDSLPKNILSPIGLKFVLEVRKNLSLPNTRHSETNDDEGSGESKND